MGLKTADEYADMAEAAQDLSSANTFATLALAAVQREVLTVQRGAVVVLQEGIDMEKARLSIVLPESQTA